MKNYFSFIKSIGLITLTFVALQSCIGDQIFTSGAILILLTGFFFLWDTWLWKVKEYNIAKILSVLVGAYNYPDLNGEWKVKYWSSYFYDESKQTYSRDGVGTITIKQSYTRIYIKGQFGDSSRFESFAQLLKEKENGDWFLVYGFDNKPVATSLQNSPSGGNHSGFCYLDISNINLMEGYYTNDENRKTRGKIVMSRKKAKA